MLDVRNMTTAMMETMRPYASLADGVRMDREYTRRMSIDVRDLTIPFSRLLWPRGRHAADGPMTENAAQRNVHDFDGNSGGRPGCGAKACRYVSRHLCE